MNESSPRPAVSVVIVSWNAWHFLEECLTSVIAENCRYPMEIIVVDNASSDGSAELVRQRFPQVRVVENKSNLAFAKANNIGVSLSKGNYLCFINSDVNVLDGCVTKLV